MKILTREIILGPLSKQIDICIELRHMNIDKSNILSWPFKIGNNLFCFDFLQFAFYYGLQMPKRILKNRKDL